MITFQEAGEMLRLTVSGVFDFDTSREMLLKCKAYTQQHKINKIDIRLEKITSCNSCAIGALILLADHAPGGFNIHLTECSEDVHQLFDSGFLDRFFSIQHTVASMPKPLCAGCFDSGYQSPVQNCNKTACASIGVYPLTH